MILFIVGCCAFFAALGCVVYWTFFKDAEEFYYPCFASITGMSVINTLFVFLGENVYRQSVVKWMSIISACLIIACIVIYIYRYIFDSDNTFERRLLIFLIPGILAAFVITFSFFSTRLTDNLVEIVSIISVLISVLFSIFTHMAYKERENKLKMDLLSIERTRRYRYDEIFFRNYLSKEELYRLEKAVTELYMRSRSRKTLSSKALQVLVESGVSSDLVHKLMDRLYTGRLLEKCSVLTLTEFMTELLPEVFALKRTYRSSSMDIRYYEDLYDELRHSLKVDNSHELDEINKKLDALNTYVKKNMNPNVKSSTSTETYGLQNQIRELFHALETPIATTEMAVTTLKASFQTLTDTQITKFDRIQDSLKLIKSILFAYRELTSMNIYNDQNTFFSLPEIINSMPEIMSIDGGNVKIEQCNIPEQIPKYSTNLIVVLLLPLIHNAVEASPDQRPVVVKCRQSDVSYIFTIENSCKRTPRQTNLDTEGYSSKGNEHIGTGISIVRRISKSAGIDFELKVNDNKVMAILTFPNR